jgi:alpha,alpha-trehalase
MEGLLKSELYGYANNLLANFMDLIDSYGFLPNGGRKYYLNRYALSPFLHFSSANSFLADRNPLSLR